MTNEPESYGMANGISADINEAQVELNDSVLRAMRGGWIPQGGIMYTEVWNDEGRQHFFCQALVKARRQAKGDTE